jgi:hypothetical protein
LVLSALSQFGLFAGFVFDRGHVNFLLQHLAFSQVISLIGFSALLVDGRLLQALL